MAVTSLSYDLCSELITAQSSNQSSVSTRLRKILETEIFDLGHANNSTRIKWGKLIV